MSLHKQINESLLLWISAVHLQDHCQFCTWDKWTYQKRNRRERSSKESLNQHVGSTSISWTSQRLTQKTSRGPCTLSCGNKAWQLVISACRVITWFFTPGSFRCFGQGKPFFLFCLLKACRQWWASNPDCYRAALVKMPEGHHVKLWSYKSVFLSAEQWNSKISSLDCHRRVETIL